jgi:hypothetical protein
MDNHSFHGIPEFEHICQVNNIVPWWFIPHMTHRCQPLDNKAFLVLKQKFRKKNNEIVRWGGGDVSDKRHFLQLIKSVRKDAFKSQTIKSSFRNTGIWPSNSHIVCDQIDPGWEDEPVLDMYGHTVLVRLHQTGNFPVQPQIPRQIWIIGSQKLRINLHRYSKMPKIFILCRSNLRELVLIHIRLQKA